MSDPTAMALIAATSGIAANLIMAWRQIVVAKEAKEAAAEAARIVIEARLEQAKSSDEIKHAVNGGAAAILASKQEIIDLKATVIRLNAVIAGAGK